MKRLLLLALTVVTLVAVTIPAAMPVMACDGCGTQGLTPGYWKNHVEAWVGYAPDQGFDAVFGTNALPGVTLLEALNLKGGGLNALARHAVAALLNTAHPEIEYACATSGALIADVVAAIDGGDEAIEALKDQLDEYNNAGVPWDD